MENNKQIFRLILMLLLCVAVQHKIFSQTRSSVQASINSLQIEITAYLKNTSLPKDKKTKADSIRNSLTALSEKLKAVKDEKANTDDAKKKVADLDAQLDALKKQYDSLIKPTNNTVGNEESIAGNDDKKGNQQQVPYDEKSQIERLKKLEDYTGINENSYLPDWLKWSLIGLSGLLILGAIAASAYFLRRNKQREREEITKNFGDLRKRQSDLTREVKDLTEVSKNLSQQMAQHKAAIGGLKQAGQNFSSFAAPPTPPINSYQSPKEESPFPVAVDDYLAKSKNGATPVKYDYKERMLVQDDAREGGLLIVRDGGGSLYLVPSFGFFQTKSDYTNYFERYFVCARPGSGSVWIRQPATVSPVNGGWQLNNQGELEVR